ncbi:hypothetical protein OIV83_005576 [Microbotryomycetes sp. JL201]|nr:hypothetical protein OIV83_005576 [Microbotryomycetes sp. JL201]
MLCAVFDQIFAGVLLPTKPIVCELSITFSAGSNDTEQYLSKPASHSVSDLRLGEYLQAVFDSLFPGQSDQFKSSNSRSAPTELHPDLVHEAASIAENVNSFLKRCSSKAEAYRLLDPGARLLTLVVSIWNGGDPTYSELRLLCGSMCILMLQPANFKHHNFLGN